MMGKPFIPSRRDILKSGGALVVSFSFGGPAREALAEDAGAPKPVALTAVDSFVAIDSAGAVTIYSGKVDLGTGVRTALTQIAAEELDVPLSKVTIVQGDTALTPDQGPTFGSLAIQIGGVQIRNACALAKSTLIDLAAKQLGANAAELKVADGIIRSGDKQASYGELIGGKTFSLTLDHQKPPATKDPKTFTLVGTSIPRLDIPDKITGKFTFMQHVRVPGMLHGRVVRPPAIGAQLQSVDDASVQGIPGVVRVVREGNFLGIVAENEWAAMKASQQIKATWAAWEGLPEQTKLFEHVRASKVAKDEVTANVGNAADAMAKRSTGEIRARKFFVLHDCGQIINPDGVQSQIEGNIIQTVSRTLKEELTFSRSAVTSLDWASYPILTFPEVPDILIDLIDRPAEKPWGAGEPSAAVVPSAISNAVFDATGVRLRSVPFTPEKVKEALRRGA
jgi:nicotinate dehydrogenase subunit B